MPQRKDGEQTYQKLLDAACVEFGARAYHEVTHAAVCKRAGANVAAINYYFGAKETLYRAVCEHGFTLAEALYPIEGGASADQAPEERLHAFMKSFIYRRCDRKRLASFHQIHMREMFNPTRLVDDLIAAWLKKMQRTVQGILREILGPNATREDIALCELNLVSPILMATNAHGKPGGPPRSMPPPPWRFAADAPEILLEHTMCFVTAGLASVKQAIEEREP